MLSHRRHVLLALVLLLTARSPAQTRWKLIWSDEFNGPANSKPDPTKWTYDLGGGGWGNQELEVYTNLVQNSHLDGNGNLVIHVDSTPSGYTSARLKTQGIFGAQSGRIEARIKLPFGQGIWPAFWMLGDNIATDGWPKCGEIDIMENIGKEPSAVHGSLHGPGFPGSPPGTTATYTLPNGRKFSDDFHTFSIQWTPQDISFYADGTLYLTVRPANVPAGGWVFNDHKFFLLLNVAVGGNFPGNPDSTSKYPQEMLVDYVRVYQADSSPSPAINPGGVVDAASFGTPLAPGSLASIFGSGLAANTTTSLFDASSGAFAQSAAGASVLVNGLPAPLTYVSPLQVNFQIPWSTLTDLPLNVEVFDGTVLSNATPIRAAATAPSAFAVNGVAIVTCVGALRAGAACTLWGNGFGPTDPTQQDGRPAGAIPLPQAVNSCALKIGGLDAQVTYCGAAPGLIISRMNFVYPAGVAATGPAVAAQVTVGGATGTVLVPAAQ